MNNIQKSSRETILNKIKSINIPKSKDKLEALDVNLYVEDNFPLIEESFIDKFTSLGGFMKYCESEIEVIQKLHELFRENKEYKNVFFFDDADDKDSLAFKIKDQIDYINQEIGSNIHYSTSKDYFSEAHVGIVVCEALVSSTGSIVLSSGSKKGRTVLSYPHTLIVLAYRSQMYKYLSECIGDISDMPSMVSIVTGVASEKTTLDGIGGPSNIHLFLINNLK